MNRRTVALLIAVAALTSCSAESVPPPAGTAPTTIASAAAETPATGAPAASATAAAAGKAPSGTLPVKVRKLRLSRGADRPLPTTVWYPATGKGPFPVIVFSHGLTARPGDYERLLTRWAGAGFVVAAPAYPHTSAGVAEFNAIDVINQPADASHVLTKVLALDTRAGDALRGRLDEAHVAAAGHSAGGITTIGMLTGDRDDRLDAAAVLAARQVLPVPFSGPPVSVLFVHGKLDRTIRYADGLAAFEAVPWPKAMLTIPNGGHVTTDGGDFNVVATATTDFWRWSLYGDPAAKRRLEARRNVESDL
ncbi:alpha/beta hydrolase family protein [Actinoplanes sp. NPDC049668]|uniref:alpha/beta hydrolase family protein n=1 Tax=unclassified Actinoplanes TaxID=2626549 RepID=UPI0033B9D6BA